MCINLYGKKEKGVKVKVNIHRNSSHIAVAAGKSKTKLGRVQPKPKVWSQEELHIWLGNTGVIRTSAPQKECTED